MRFVLDQDVDARVAATLRTHGHDAWNVIGRHIFLRRNEWDGIRVIEQHLDTILPVLERNADLWIKLSLGTEPEYSHDWK